MIQDLSIKWLDTVDSTQDEVRRHLPQLANLSVVAARSQTAGRGQRGNRWITRPGENLTFSVLLRPGQDGVPAIGAEDQFLLSEWFTLAIRQALAAYGVRSRIKWPNDIYAGDRKICGMLIENILQEGKVLESIIGIGLNVNQLDFDPGLLNPTSMARLTGKTFRTGDVLDTVLERFRVLAGTDRAAVRALFLEDLYRKDEWHRYTDCSTGAVFEGMIKGITARGEVRIAMPDGMIREFGFKQVSYII